MLRNGKGFTSICVVFFMSDLVFVKRVYNVVVVLPTYCLLQVVQVMR